jgi:hypothetical protein
VTIALSGGSGLLVGNFPGGLRLLTATFPVDTTTYEPPDGDGLVFNFTGLYVPPAANNMDLNFTGYTDNVRVFVSAPELWVIPSMNVAFVSNAGVWAGFGSDQQGSIAVTHCNVWTGSGSDQQGSIAVTHCSVWAELEP